MIGARVVGALALLAGCSTDPYVAQMRVDLGPCLEVARQEACGGAWLDVLNADARACLVVRGASGVDTVRLAYDAQTHTLTPEAGSIEQPLSAGDLVTLEVLTLRPGATECPAFAADDSCADHPTCMGSFGREPVTVDGDGALDVTYGGKDGAGCEPTCHPQCQVEACNALDDDCDGQIDEDFKVGQECVGAGACGVGRFECAEVSGEARCSVDPLGSEEATAPEDCNGLDDDCDGETDEAGALMEAGVIGGLCGSNEGACQAGAAKCVEGAGLCDGEVPPAAELCDGVDNDCDGQIDEDFGLRVGDEDVALGRPCQGVGGCGTGRVQCAPDASAACCSTSPECGGVGLPETCDGVDNDCDGVTDEVEDLVATGEVGAACGDDTGQCAAGLSECVVGQLRCAGESAPTDEACDGLDNDCDGEVDERADLALRQIVGVRCGSSVGECRVGLLECQGARLTCVGEGTPAQEACDGRDNDCDGEADELAGLQQAGAVGGECGTDTGACVRGRDTCQGGRTVCEGAVASAPETCDGVDQDCDGDIDEAADLRDAGIVGGSCGTDEGLCVQGEIACVGGALTCGGPAVGPAEERCDGDDNDCDGDIDESDPTLGGLCGTDVGVCETGTITGCDGGVLTCDGATDPDATDICNGLDDDCDGDVDEDYRDGAPALGDACDNPAAENCEGVVVCTQDNQAVCCSTDVGCLPEDQRDAELCDGADNDCDGGTDEGLGLGDACAGVGECPDGVLECDDDDPTAAARCSTLEGGSDFPIAAELCDGLDNDCDGDVDETWRLGDAGVGEHCQGVGYCGLPGAGQGLVECDAGLAAVRCSTDLGGSIYAGQAETCDGVDDDCDGAVDEDFGVGRPCDGVGACGAGVLECDPGNEAAALCSTDRGGSAVEASVEFCDDVDDDCDGVVDNGFPLGQACDGDDLDACAHGVFECQEDGLGVACGVESQVDLVELCNGVDDDCDDTVDEDNPGGGGECGIDVGECAFGTEACVDGALACQGGTGPADEACDGLDNDCDGQVDEGDPGGGAPCGERLGECQPGVLSCQEGALACVGGQGPVAELCDGLDNDCDGAVDNGFDAGGQPLGGLCGGDNCGATWTCAANGAATCCASDPACDPDFEPGDELCDGLDNDCDDAVDEDIAGLGEVCSGGGQCPDGVFQCDDDPTLTRCSTDPGGSDYVLVPEVCDGLDQDCDGAVDNGFDVGLPCEGTGECEDGSLECDPDDDAAVLCDTDPRGSAHVPTDEACTGADDDCDGAVDEGFAVDAPCDGGDDDLCEWGTYTCAANGLTVECLNEDLEGVVELCNDVDDDCDEAVDEAAAGVGDVCGTAEGACEEGVQDCAGGELVCVGDHVGPVDELCDTFDNDCDTSTDEGFDVGDACDGDDDDECAFGTYTCTGDGLGVECVNEDPAGVVEVCGDGVDDDCDGEADEGCCPQLPDFAACEDGVVDDPLSYDICIGDACISPGCGLLNCAVSGAPFGVVADPRDPPLAATAPAGNGEEVVVDDATGLTWTRSADTSDDGDVDGDDDMNWAAAVQWCEDLDFAGFDDWRLPDRYELFTAVDLEDDSQPVFGVFTVSDDDKRLWTVSVDSANASKRWVLKMRDGRSETKTNTESHYVLCVRGAPLGGAPVADPRYTVTFPEGDRVITDGWTGLQWRGIDSTNVFRQVDAQNTCDWASGRARNPGDPHGGHDDWVVPTMRQLSTLIDHRQASNGQADPVFKTGGHNDASGSRWSATEYKPNQSKAWRVNFGDGQITKESKDNGSRRYKVRCVRVP